jgi:hypothetical protein
MTQRTICAFASSYPKRRPHTVTRPTTFGGFLANLWHAATVGESREPLVLVGATGFEPVTSSVSGKRSPAELRARRTRSYANGWRRCPELNRGTGFCRPLPEPLGHTAVPALVEPPSGVSEGGEDGERMTGLEPATLTLAR